MVGNQQRQWRRLHPRRALGSVGWVGVGLVVLLGLASWGGLRNGEGAGAGRFRGQASILLRLEAVTGKTLNAAQHLEAVETIRSRFYGADFQTRLASRAHVPEDSFRTQRVEIWERGKEMRLVFQAVDGGVADSLMDFVELELGNEFAGAHSPLSFEVVDRRSGRRQSWWRESVQTLNFWRERLGLGWGGG